MTQSELLKKGAESGKAAAKLADQVSKSQQAMEAANLIQDPAEKAKKIKEIESGLRASQADAVRAIGGQFLKGDDKKRFDTALETSKLLRERIINHPDDYFPSWEDLTRDPTDQGRTPLQMLQSNFGDLSSIAKAAGYEKEFNALNAGMQVADLLDRYGLGDGAFSDIFGTKKQLDDLAKQLEKGDISSLGLGQAGIGLANLQAGLGMISALGGVFGFGKDIAKVQKSVSALQGLQKAFSGDIAGGIDGILALDGLLFDLPPEAKEALSMAKELVNGLKKMGSMKPLTASGSGVYVEGKQIAALGLSGTVHGMPLMPGPGSANVTVYSMPVWRTNSDKHVCTLPGPGPAPHMPPPGGMVPVGATKTYANSLLIARHDDSTIEANGGGMVKIIPLPEAMAIAIKRAKEEAERKRKEEEKKKADKEAKSGKKGGEETSDKKRGPLSREERAQRKSDMEKKRDREIRANERERNRDRTIEEKNAIDKQAVADARDRIAAGRDSIDSTDPADRESFANRFGTDNEETRNSVREQYDGADKYLESYQNEMDGGESFERDENVGRPIDHAADSLGLGADRPGIKARSENWEEGKDIEVRDDLPGRTNSFYDMTPEQRAHVITHEAFHQSSEGMDREIGSDHAYGDRGTQELADSDPERAKKNADSYAHHANDAYKRTKSH